LQNLKDHANGLASPFGESVQRKGRKDVSIAERLWEQLAADFRDDDDRELPDVYIEPLTKDQLCEIYLWVRSQSEIYTESGEPLLWDVVEQRNVAIAAVEDPCESVMAGPFRHGLSRLTVAGVELPSLTLAVWPDRISLDYQVGAHWGPSQLSAFFEFLWTIQQKAPQAEISHFHEGLNERTKSFDVAWQEYKRFRSDQTTA
jgi:hypothetical protein